MASTNYEIPKSVKDNADNPYWLIFNHLTFYYIETGVRCISAQDLLLFFDKNKFPEETVSFAYFSDRISKENLEKLSKPFKIQSEGKIKLVYSADFFVDLLFDISKANVDEPTAIIVKNQADFVLSTLSSSGVGLIPLIDEILGIDLTKVNYAKEFNKMIQTSFID